MNQIDNLYAKETAKAIDAFQRAIEIDPTYSLAHRERASAFAELGQVDQ